VLFRATGAPVLAGFARCTLFEPDLTAAALAERSDVRADRSGIASLVRAVLGRAGIESSDWLDAAQAEGFPDPMAESLGDWLFSLAESQPVRFGADPDPQPLVPARAVSPAEPPPRSVVVTGVALPEWLQEALDGSPVAALRERLVSAVRGVRRPVWWVFGAVGVALVAALVLVPQGERGASRAPSPAEATETPIAIDQVADGPIIGDDPVAALTALLELRATCLRDLSVLCLDAVLEPGSSALDADAAMIRRLQDGGELQDALLLEPVAPTLVERLGDSALVSLGATEKDAGNSEPASVLLMKGEAGWRIRGYVAGAGP